MLEEGAGGCFLFETTSEKSLVGAGGVPQTETTGGGFGGFDGFEGVSVGVDVGFPFSWLLQTEALVFLGRLGGASTCDVVDKESSTVGIVS